MRRTTDMSAPLPDPPTFCEALLFRQERFDMIEYPCDIVGAHPTRDGRKVHTNKEKVVSWVGDR